MERSINANKQYCHEYDVIVRQAVYRELNGVHMCTRSGAGAGGGVDIGDECNLPARARTGGIVILCPRSVGYDRGEKKELACLMPMM